jgi:hypothetical protein
MQEKFKIIKDVIPVEFCHYITHIMLRNKDLVECGGDNQVPECKSILSHEPIIETLQERMWGRFEKETGLQLIPTYSYARLYENGHDMKAHTDRPACEISVTIQLGRSHHYAYPIYMDGQRIELAEGDAVLYRGMDVEHWRDVCDGADGYYSGQAFMHYVDKNGKHADQVGDPQRTDGIYSYKKDRSFLMEFK